MSTISIRARGVSALTAAALTAAASTAAVALAALAGCSSGTHGEHAAVSAGPSTGGTAAGTTTTQILAPAPSASTVVLPKGAIPAELVGTYTYEENGTWHVTLRSDGSYGQWNPHDELDVTGHFGVAGHVAVFMDEAQDGIAGVACAGPGSYAWRFSGRHLTMTVRSDHCTVGRIEQWTAGWTKVSSKQLKLTTPMEP